MLTDINHFSLILLGVCSFAVLTLIVYYLYFFTGLKYEPSANESTIPVSVLIAARNERKNLEVNLPHFFNQDYPNFEIIVINDGSWDGTKDFLKELKLLHKNLKIVTVDVDEKFKRGKKFALTMGIKAASHDHLLFADADCKPTSDQWIKAMLSCFKNKDIVLGNSPLIVKKNLLGSMVNYETFHTAIQYLGYANKGLPYMGVGRNLAYTKQVFFENKGFASHQHIMSGDDDLFVQEVANKKNTAICLDPKSFTHSAGPPNMKAWITQKTRHLSTGSFYKTKFKFLLGVYSILQLALYASAILFIVLNPTKWYLAVGIIGLKWVIQWIILYGPSKRLGYSKIGYALPYYDILYTLFLLTFGIAKPFLKPKTWN